MREIKFRGKDYSDQWVYGDLIHKRHDKESVLIQDHKGLGSDVDTITIGQYTGLKDKNGKEIYEGDILRGNEYPFNCDGVDNYFAEIVWADNVCGFYIVTHKKPNSTVRGIAHGNWSQLDKEDIESFEVIGNIHDNPELIKEVKKNDYR